MGKNSKSLGILFFKQNHNTPEENSMSLLFQSQHFSPEYTLMWSESSFSSLYSKVYIGSSSPFLIWFVFIQDSLINSGHPALILAILKIYVNSGRIRVGKAKFAGACSSFQDLNRHCTVWLHFFLLFFFPMFLKESRKSYLILWEEEQCIYREGKKKNQKSCFHMKSYLPIFWEWARLPNTGGCLPMLNFNLQNFPVEFDLYITALPLWLKAQSCVSLRPWLVQIQSMWLFCKIICAY